MNQSQISAPFLNREGEFDPDGWFHLVPKGTFPITRLEKDGVRRTYFQVIDDTAVDRIVAAFANKQQADPGYRIMVGFEHFAHQSDKSSEAACWVDAMEVRPDGVWAKGKWTDIGEAAVKNRRFRYLSPVWFPRQTETIAENRFRPVEVNDAGLTNKPNLGDALQPFWNREEFNGREASTHQPTHQNTMKDRLIALFKMDAGATDDQVIGQATAFMNRAAELDTLKGTHDTLRTTHTALENRFKTLLSSSVTAELEANKDVIPEGQQDAWKNRLEADFDGTAALLRGLKRPEKGKTHSPVHKPGKGAAAAATKTEGEDESAQDAFMNRVAEVMTKRDLDKADAIAAVASDEPDLYAAYREELNSGE
ncbi:phage protease [Actomonas aquatica]|uniref:Phage protease n=1 Tax=Actomonas aquatica TaxID=2866162 RepID=A0ABZ1CGK5_9BACT|nr:phage protease [Opitutus sp. WL0086]WRQ89400.1 phage protease [Opitutus sp. WL0086]